MAQRNGAFPAHLRRGVAGQRVDQRDDIHLDRARDAERGDAVAVSMVWLVANTTVKGRHDEDMQALRQALRLKTTPAPIAPLPIPPEASQPKPEQSLKPMGSEAQAALAATGGI